MHMFYFKHRYPHFILVHVPTDLGMVLYVSKSRGYTRLGVDSLGALS